MVVVLFVVWWLQCLVFSGQFAAQFFRYLQTYFPQSRFALLLVMIAGSIFVHGFYAWL